MQASFDSVNDNEIMPNLGKSVDRSKGNSPHKVQELINRYNLNNLKMSLNIKGQE